MNPSQKSSPVFSVVIPTCNRPQSLAGCLKSLAVLDYPREQFEVVIVDDGGKSPLDALVEDYSREIDLRHLRQENGGPASARNAGVRTARGRFIAFTDDDCAPATDWLSSLQERFRQHPDCAIAGRAENGLPQNVFSSASQLLIDYLCDYYNVDQEAHVFGTSNNLSFPRRSFLEIGGFDESFTQSAAEDRELIDRWVRSGNKLVYAREVTVSHFHSMDLLSYSKQHARYGRGAYRYHRARALRTADGVKPEPLRFYHDMLGYPFKRDHRPLRAMCISLLIGWSQVMNVLGFMREKLSNGSRHLDAVDSSHR